MSSVLIGADAIPNLNREMREGPVPVEEKPRIPIYGTPNIKALLTSDYL